MIILILFQMSNDQKESSHVQKYFKRPKHSTKPLAIITGLQHMSHTSNWKILILSLFIKARLPPFYVLNITSPEYYTTSPNTALISFINQYVYKKSKMKLNILLKRKFKDSVYII